MKEEIDTFAYMMGAEKIGNLVFCLEMTMNFMEEYGIEPDEEVMAAMIPSIERVRKWLQVK